MLLRRLTLLIVLATPGLALGQTSLTELDESQATDPVSEAVSDDQNLQNLNDLTIPELIALAQERFDNENYLLAKNLVRVILLRDENNIEASLLDAEMALKEGETDRARTRYKAVIAIEPDEYNANFGLGKLYARSKLHRQAKFYLERASRTAPPEDKSELLTLLARTYRGMGNSREALETIIKAVQASDGDVLPALEYLVKLRTEGADYQNAMIDSEKLVDLARRDVIESPSELTAVERLYAAYNTQLEVLRSFAQDQYKLNPDGSRSDQLQPGREQVSADTMRRIVDVMIVQAELLRTMAYFSMIELTKKGIDYNPDNIGLQMQYGLLLRNTSQMLAARKAFEKVLQLDPDNAEARRQLAGLPAAPITPDMTEEQPPTEETDILDAEAPEAGALEPDGDA